MAIFNSYVKLPEGNCKSSFSFQMLFNICHCNVSNRSIWCFSGPEMLLLVPIDVACNQIWRGNSCFFQWKATKIRNASWNIGEFSSCRGRLSGSPLNGTWTCPRILENDFLTESRTFSGGVVSGCKTWGQLSCLIDPDSKRTTGDNRWGSDKGFLEWFRVWYYHILSEILSE